MCGESFWKRAVVFCLAFGLSVFVSDFFSVTKSKRGNVDQLSDSVSKGKSCVPADGNLEYLNLPYYENVSPISEAEKPLTPQTKDKKEKSKKLEVKKRFEEKESKPKLYVPEKDPAEYQILLHKERCFETQEQK